MVLLEEDIIGKWEGGIVGGGFELFCMVVTVLFVVLLSVQSSCGHSDGGRGTIGG